MCAPRCWKPLPGTRVRRGQAQAMAARRGQGPRPRRRGGAGTDPAPPPICSSSSLLSKLLFQLYNWGTSCLLANYFYCIKWPLRTAFVLQHDNLDDHTHVLKARQQPLRGFQPSWSQHCLSLLHRGKAQITLTSIFKKIKKNK